LFSTFVDGRRDHYKAACASHVDVGADLAALVVVNINPGRRAVVAMLAPIRAPRSHRESYWQRETLPLQDSQGCATFNTVNVDHS
jgi:hypothetical protein